MENAKKQLKMTSLFILFFAFVAVVKTVINIFVGVSIPDELPEGISLEFFKTFVTILNVCALVFVLPDLYIGYMGCKMAGGHPYTKAAAVWATILLVISAISLISGISSLLSGKDLLNNLLATVISVCDVALYFFYVKYAKQLRDNG